MRRLRPRTPGSLRRFGLTVDEWRELVGKFNGRCWICGKGGLTKHLSVDHDHTLARLGKMWVRGLLCQRCNRALGAFEWDDDVLARAIDYMQRISLTRSAFVQDNSVPLRDNTKEDHLGGTRE